MNRTWNFAPIGTLGLGAGLMYFLDPRQGRRRRSVLRDKAASKARRLACAARNVWEDATNRAYGTFCETMGALRPGQRRASDAVIEDRVRARLGRAVSHPHAIIVRSEDGCVTLAGQVLAEEQAAAVGAARGARGVCEVEDRLEAHEQPRNLPALQGGAQRRRRRPGGARFELAQENWSPAARLLAGAAGCAAIAYGAPRRGLVGAAAVAGGAGVLLRAATNLDARRLTGLGAGRKRPGEGNEGESRPWRGIGVGAAKRLILGM